MTQPQYFWALVAGIFLLSTYAVKAHEDYEYVNHFESPNVQTLLADKARRYDAQWANYGNAIINRPILSSVWQVDTNEVLSFDAKTPFQPHQVRYQLCKPYLSVEDSPCVSINDFVQHEHIRFGGRMTGRGPYKHRHVARIRINPHIKGMSFQERGRYFIKVQNVETAEEIFVTEPFLLIHPSAPALKAKSQVHFERSRYTRLGSGAFGDVYRGHLTDRYRTPVAIKTIRLRNAEDWWAVHNEVVTLQSLQHPNILSLLFEWEERNRVTGVHEWCLVSELAQGGDLETAISDHHINEWMRKQGHFQNVLKQVVSGLEYMHQKGYIHRDIKPSNILVMTANYDEGSLHPPKVKIADLGLSCYASGKCKSWRNMACGTRYYMAPEMDYEEMKKTEQRQLLQQTPAMVADNVFAALQQSLPASPLAACHRILAPNQLVMKVGDTVPTFKTYYDASVDMWALGAIAFRFMSGSDERGSLSSKLRTVRPGSAQGLSASDQMALSFLTSLLVRDGTLRMSAREAAKHPYLHPHKAMVWPWQQQQQQASQSQQQHVPQVQQETTFLPQLVLPAETSWEEVEMLADGEPMMIDEVLPSGEDRQVQEAAKLGEHHGLLAADQRNAHARPTTAEKAKKRRTSLKRTFKMNKSKYLMARLLHLKQRSAMEMRSNQIKPTDHHHHPMPFWQLRKHYQQLHADFLKQRQRKDNHQHGPTSLTATKQPPREVSGKHLDASHGADAMDIDQVDHLGLNFESLRVSEL